MSSRTLWVRGPICGVDNCRSRLYRSTDGHKVCQYGHVMEGQIEINDDQDDNFTVTRRLDIQLTGIGGDFSQNSSSRGVQESQTQERLTKLYGMAGRRHYLKVLQVVLKKQVEIVCSQLIKLDPESTKQVESQVKLYWMRLVSRYWSIHDDKPTATQTQTTQATQDGEHSNISASSEKINAPTVLDSTAIVYLVLLEQNHTPVYVTNFLHWIKLNQIPFIKTLYLVPPSLLGPLPQHYYILLQPPTLPIQNELVARISQLAIKLSQPLPLSLKSTEADIPPITVSVNYYYLWIYRVLSQKFILPSSITIFHMVCHMADQLNLEKLTINSLRTDTFPEVEMMALVLFCIKISLLFKITNVNFRQWVKQLHQLDFSSPDYLASLDKLINWSDEKVNQYCDWVYSNLLPSTNSEDNSIMKKRLHQIFEYPELDRSSPVPSESTPQSHLERLIDSTKKPTSLSKADLHHLENTLVSRGLDLLGVTTEVMTSALNTLETKIKTDIIGGATGGRKWWSTVNIIIMIWIYSICTIACSNI